MRRAPSKSPLATAGSLRTRLTIARPLIRRVRFGRFINTCWLKVQRAKKLRLAVAVFINSQEVQQESLKVRRFGRGLSSRPSQASRSGALFARDLF